MTKYETILSSIYCLSQEASYTIINLRALPSYANNIHSYTMYVLLQELHSDALQAFKDISLSEEETEGYLEELFSIGAILKQIYDLCNISKDSACNQDITKKFEHQIESLLFALSKLYELEKQSHTTNGPLLVME